MSRADNFSKKSVGDIMRGGDDCRRNLNKKVGSNNGRSKKSVSRIMTTLRDDGDAEF